MKKLEQNSYLWILPNDKENTKILQSKQTTAYSFIECFDGKFSYEVWVYTKNENDVKIRMDIDNKNIYENMKITAKKDYSWQLYGNFQVVKGEHKITLTNNDNSDIELCGVLITRNASYVHNGTATNHLKEIKKGRTIDELLIESGIEISTEETPEQKQKRLKNLYKMGFIERFDQDLSEGKGRNGVPMGGIGAGKVELDQDGVITSITTNNNCEVPIFKTEGSFFAVWCKQKDMQTSRMLQKVNYNKYDLPTIEDIEFKGVFPTAQLKYIDSNLPVKITLDAYSFLIPNDIKNSSIPAVTFDFTVCNNTNEDVETAIMFSWENIIGTGGSMANKSQSNRSNNSYVMNTWNPGFTWSDRTGNYQTANNNYITFKAKSDNCNPSSFGEYTILCDSNDNVTAKSSWDTALDTEKLWQEFSCNGTLTDDESLVGDEDTSYIAGAISKKITLKSNETKKITFILSWYMPHYIDSKLNDIGVYYINNFKNSHEVANYIQNNKNDLLFKTLELKNQLTKSSLPNWLIEKILNDMFPIYTCSWFSKDKKFAINEAPTGMMGCLGTMDQRLACNVIYTNLFTELDVIELELFRQCQGLDGSISHDLGFGCFDISPRGGTWSDLCSSFIMQVYKHYIYTGNKEFLNTMYPHVKKATQYQISIDYDRNNIPDVGAGNGTTYDTYHWYGTSAFVASLWLAGLKVCCELAKIMDDNEFNTQCEDLFYKAQKSMINELWNDKYEFGGYFNNYNDSINNKHSENCFIAQLAGQWFTNLMDLGDILPKDKINETIKTVTKRNVEIKNIVGMNDETTPEGDFGGYGYTFAQYNEVYYGCLAIYNDFVKEGINCFKKVHNISVNSPWNVVLTYFTDGTFTGLPYYMTNPASSFILEALSGYVPNVAQRTLKIAPHIEGNSLSMPLYSPCLWLWLDYEKLQNQIAIKFKAIKIINKTVQFDKFITTILSDIKIKNITINNKQIDFNHIGNRVELHYNFDMLQDKEFIININY